MISHPFAWLKNQLHRLQPAVNALPCFWQTDIHSHLIANIDDGVKTYEESLTCIRQLADWGVHTMITTPHISHAFYPNQESTLLAGRDALQQEIDQAAIPVQIRVAAEYMLDEYFLDRLESTPLLSFGAERYLLVETGLIARPLLLDEMLFRIQTSGYTPVLAHPERYPYFINDPEALGQLRDQGCLFQLNWMSLTGRYGAGARNQGRFLLKNKWVDFIGSDLHRPKDLPALEALFNSSAYELLSQQPLLNHTL